VAIGFALAALSLANSLLAGVLERRREIGVLKATGWRTETVTRLFLAEGSLLGLLGGLLGVLGGVAFFTAVYQSLSPNLLWISLVGLLLPVLVGSWAALYPARVAARIPPAEAVRYE
jgi:putative ABC transport system permease protein